MNALAVALIERARCITCGFPLYPTEPRETQHGVYFDSPEGLCGFCKGDRNYRLAAELRQMEVAQ